MGDGSKDTVAAIPPPAPKDIFDSFASNARDRENFRLLAAQGMKSNFLTGLRGTEGGPQVTPGLPPIIGTPALGRQNTPGPVPTAPRMAPAAPHAAVDPNLSDPNWDGEARGLVWSPQSKRWEDPSAGQVVDTGGGG